MNALSLKLIYLMETAHQITLVGKDAKTGDHASIQIDLRPCAAYPAALGAMGGDQTAYTAEGVTVRLEFEVGEPAAMEDAA